MATIPMTAAYTCAHVHGMTLSSRYLDSVQYSTRIQIRWIFIFYSMFDWY